MAFFQFLKMAAVRHLGFSKVEILTARTLLRAKVRHHAKFHKDRSNRSGDMAGFSIFKMAAAAILFFFGNFKFVTVATLKRFELRLRAKFCRNRSNPCSDIAIYRFFMMAAVRHHEFSKVGNFNFRSHSEVQYAFRRYGRFSIFKMAAAAILFFLEILNF